MCIILYTPNVPGATPVSRETYDTLVLSWGPGGVGLMTPSRETPGVLDICKSCVTDEEAPDDRIEKEDARRTYPLYVAAVEAGQPVVVHFRGTRHTSWQVHPHRLGTQEVAVAHNGGFANVTPRDYRPPVRPTAPFDPRQRQWVYNRGYVGGDASEEAIRQYELATRVYDAALAAYWQAFKYDSMFYADLLAAMPPGWYRDPAAVAAEEAKIVGRGTHTRDGRESRVALMDGDGMVVLFGEERGRWYTLGGDRTYHREPDAPGHWTSYPLLDLRTCRMH